MQHQQIRVGMTLRLKAERQKAYGLAFRDVAVSGLKFRPGYKVPFVLSGEFAYTPSDFAREA